jgi:RHS repeat-associated protein
MLQSRPQKARPSAMRLFGVAVMCIVGAANATIYHSVGPYCDYPTLTAAVAGLVPLTDDVELEVYVGPEGFTEPGAIIEATPAFNGHTITLTSTTTIPLEVTYYVGNEIEYRKNYADNSVTSVEYINGPDALARRVGNKDGVSSDNQYYIKNHLGSTMMLVNGEISNPATDILAVYDYYAYGKKVVEKSTSEDPVTQMFTGKEADRYDPDMAEGEDGEGYCYFGRRYFDAEIGLWTACDPTHEFWSAFSYTSGNPISFIDKLGLTEIYFMLGGTYDPKIQGQLISFDEFQNRLDPVKQLYESKDYKVEYQILTKQSFIAALKDPDVQFIYILSHGANNTAALKSMKKGEFIYPSDAPEKNSQPVIRAAACYQGTFESKWQEFLYKFQGLFNQGTSVDEGIKAIIDNAENSAKYMPDKNE